MPYTGKMCRHPIRFAASVNDHSAELACHGGCVSRQCALQPTLKSLNIDHAYKCTDNINSYNSLTDWSHLGGDYGEVAGTSSELDNGYFSSEYTIDNANISESFAAHWWDATLNNSLLLKFELKKSRTDGLDVSALQIVESYSDEYVFGTGYRIDDFGAIVHLNNNKAEEHQE